MNPLALWLALSVVPAFSQSPAIAIERAFVHAEELAASMTSDGGMPRVVLTHWRAPTRPPRAEAERPRLEEVVPGKPAQVPRGFELPESVRRTLEYHESMERRNLSVLVFRAGFDKVLRSAAEEKKEWAVVLDVDETVLDNSRYWVQNRFVFAHETWSAWVHEQRGTPVPGAKEFLDQVRALPRGRVVYITDRPDALREPTIANLRKHGLFQDGDGLLTKSGPEDTKAVRRACVEGGSGRCRTLGARRILALFGDSMGDFIELPKDLSELTAQQRRELESHRNWNERWFLIPNPLYGLWNGPYVPLPTGPNSRGR